jgi:putative ABC transport system permease protein
VLLLVNIFVMLADDRRSELGMIRALGLRRLPLVTTFATEGWCYAVVASALGALLGIGVGRVIAWRADEILSTGREVDVIDMRFAFDRTTIVAGFAIGLVISIITIVLTSIRTARINVIAAIRNLPDVKPPKQSRRRTGLGLAAALLGAGLTMLGFGAPDEYALILGPSLVALGIGVLLAGRVTNRTLISTLALFVFVWATASVPIGTSLGTALDIPLFFVQGVLMSAAAITFVVAQEDRVARFLARVSGDALPVRIGLAYPLARRFRTAMTLGMFSIVVLTLVFMSQLVYMFDSQSADLTRKLSGGFGGVITSNPSNPIPPDALNGVGGIDRVAPMAYLYATMTRPGAEPVDWPLSGFGPELVAAPPVLEDRGTYKSDRAAWEAVRADPRLIIADEFFASPPGGPPTSSLEVGDRVVVQDPVTGDRRTLTVAAVSTDDYLASGAYMGIDGMREIFGSRAVPSRYFVGGDDVPREVQRIRREFMANGADGDTVRGLIDVLFGQNNAFFTLMQQFVAVGLVVGIAGIGVIMVRAVRERRRQVGVLRALGFGKRTVASSFLVEASFVAVSGTLMGVGIALIATWGLTTSGASWAEGLQYGVAWQDIGLIVGLAVLAALAAAVFPARAASDIRPAVALRLAD